MPDSLCFTSIIPITQLNKLHTDALCIYNKGVTIKLEYHIFHINLFYGRNKLLVNSIDPDLNQE